MALRIEVYEKYVVNPIDEDEKERLTNLRLKLPKEEYNYRRTFVLVDTIDRPIEILGNKTECVLLFFSGEQMTIKDSYDEFCIKLNDLEMQTDIENLMNEE